MNPEILPPEPSPQEKMLQHAIDSIRQEKFAQARDILTKLLRYDQNNPTYWVWMSAAMETQKERLYCLQAAYKLDPTDATARRGLILMGALPPDDSIAPFPMNHPRPWENKLKLADEKPKEKGLKRLTGNPVFRLAAIFGVAGIAIIGAIIGVGMLITRPMATQYVMGTPRPTVTPYRTEPPETKPTLPPLEAQLEATYTATAIYALTPHRGASQDSYNGAVRSYNSGQWDNVVIMMEQVATSEPGSADTLYFAGEARRMAKRYNEAIDYYNEAIKANPNYAPSYLGRALASLAANPRKNVISDLDKAIDLDPNYAEAFLQRGLYYMKRSDFANAMADVAAADEVNPGSPLIKIALARVLLAQDENEAALEAAIQANQLDVTMLEGYLVLGMAYRANGDIDKAVEVLETYVQYQPDNAEAFTVLGAAYFNDGEYETALKQFQQALKLDRTNSEAYFWLGELYLRQGNQEPPENAAEAEELFNLAVENFEKAVQYNATSFRNAEGLARGYLAIKEWGNAYVAVGKVEKLAVNDTERGQFLYVSAIANQNLNAANAAIRAWNELLALPEEAVPLERREEAQKNLDLLKKPTKVPPTPTVTRTPTPNISSTPSNTPLPKDTRQPSNTPTPTNTRQPSATPKP